MPVEKVIPPEVLKKIRVGGLLSNVFSKCFVKKLAETYAADKRESSIMMDISSGETYLLPGKGKVTIKVGEGKLIAPNQTLLDDVYEKLIVCAGANTSAIPLPEIQKKVLPFQLRGTTIAMSKKLPLSVGKKVADFASSGTVGQGRKTRKGKKRTRKMSRRRR